MKLSDQDPHFSLIELKLHVDRMLQVNPGFQAGPTFPYFFDLLPLVPTFS